MFYNRSILPKLEKEIDTEKIVVLTGMRQVGKTTLLRYLFEQIKSKNKVFLDAENPLHRKIFEEEDYDNVWQNLAVQGITQDQKAYIFIDEIQNLPVISKVAKYLYDHYKVKFFLTGSSSFYLKNLFPESMAGRKFVFELFPLTFSEYLVFKGKKRNTHYKSFSAKSKNKNKIFFELFEKDYEQYIEFGGFPAVVLEEDVNRKGQILEEIFTSYFENDVKSLADFKDMSKVRDLILLLVSRVGSKLDISKIASELSTSRETIYNYLSFLEQTYFISLLPRYSKSFDRSAAGSKKVFLCDCGMANFLGKLSEGQVLENSVFQNLRPFYKLSYYSNRKTGKEIDFVLKDASVALEIKRTASKKDLDNLSRSSLSIGIKEKYVASLNFSKLENTILVSDL